MRKGFNQHIFDDAFRGTRIPRQPNSQEVTRVMDRVLTQHPRMSGKQQTLLEMKVRDEFSRRYGNKIRWPF